MEIISGHPSSPRKIKYFGKGSEFAIIYFKNIILTVLTFGIYYPWAKVEILKYHYQSSELDDSRFQFHATGMEVFRGFIKIYLILVILYAYLFFGLQTQNDFIISIAIGAFYLFFIIIIPFAIHGAVRYRASRSSWKGIYFKYIGSKREIFSIYLKGIILTTLTLGLYGPWLQVELRKYVLQNLRFGNVSFDFKGKGGSLLWINVKLILLFYITLGIYSFWYYKNLWTFFIDNTTIKQNDEELKLRFHMSVSDVFELLVINFILIFFTLGLATPWVTVRTLNFFFRFSEIDGYLDTNAITQVSYDDYDDAAGDDFLDFLDFDLL
ncbi:MAG: hypothetical protein CMB99_04930 [Flavobacteriaceae bacterium]|nr:hypothetical protein [Flavobacteriaceae bacterium]|tara:strand:+ start:118530 stop:119501 length:972 start_codon:yes stop_codon:yes gene_type:complete